MEESNRGVLLERRAAPGEAGHAAFLLEALYDEAGLPMRMMLAAARSLPFLQAGAHFLPDLPPGAVGGTAPCRRRVMKSLFMSFRRSTK
jgi:diaminopimelate dehydrogenase